jgi:predicted enzyme related to lactoylglutathione lyase
MCDDIHATVAELKEKGVKVAAEIKDAGWGLLTSFEIPGGSKLQLYQPKHPTAIQPKPAN